MLLQKGPPMEIKKCSALLSVLILASLMSVSSTGGGHRKLIEKSLGYPTQDFSKKPSQEVIVLHHRILRVTTNDYANYEPTPSLSKPPFKLIPN